MFLALMVGGALGQSFAQEHGWRKVLPIALPLTICLGAAIGWGLSGEFNLVSLNGGSGQ